MEQIKEDLKNCTTKNTDKFSFDGQRFLCKCIKVYDGDTVTVAFKPFSHTERIYKYSIRLSGIDTPEIRTINPQEKIEGIKIRDLLSDRILNKFMYIECGGFDKYGRLLGHLFDEDNDNINEWLIKEGYAYNYDGGTKKVFESPEQTKQRP
jgi:micrococcal nuclease